MVPTSHFDFEIMSGMGIDYVENTDLVVQVV